MWKNCSQLLESLLFMSVQQVVMLLRIRLLRFLKQNLYRLFTS
jgi:hypothetical protein